MKKLVFILTLVPLLLFAKTNPQQKLKQKMVEHLDFIKGIFETQYAPIEWKKSHLQWDLDERIADIKRKIVAKKHISIKDFQRLLMQFFNSTSDHHTKIFFYSTAAAILPFRIQSAEGRYFITWIMPSNTKNSSKLPLEVGDEVLFFDGKPIQKVMQELRKEEFGDVKTDQRLDELMLTTRLGALGQSVPEGTVEITIKELANGKVNSYHIPWLVNLEEITPGPYRNMSNSFFVPGHLLENDRPHSNLFDEMSTIYYEPIQARYQKLLKGSEDFIGNKIGCLPCLGKMVTDFSSIFPFRAYIFQNVDGKLIGYIRIADYLFNDKYLKKLVIAIDMMEKHTEALIIDQLDNTGGAILNLYNVLSLLTTKPLKLPKLKFCLKQENISEALTELKDLSESKEKDDYLMTKDNLKEYYSFLISEWNAGRNITVPYYYYGIKEINPHPTTQYKKAIVILTNCRSFSAADFLSAILQDNQAALIFGEKTAGAGGSFNIYSYPNIFGIKKFGVTSSIAERLDNTPIENLGVTPDIPYELTPNDLQNKYQDYIKAIQEVLLELT